MTQPISKLLMVLFALPVLASFALAGCHEETKPLPPRLPDFELQVTPEAQVVAGHATQLRVSIHTASPLEREEFAAATLRVSLPAQPEVLSGVLAKRAEQSGDVIFDGLTFSRAGHYQLQIGVEGYRTHDIGLSISVQARLQLEFSSVPDRIMRDQPFMVAMQVRDTLTRELSSPDQDMLVTLRAKGVANELAGARTATFEAGESHLRFDALSYPTVEYDLRLEALSTELEPITSDSIACDGIGLHFLDMLPHVTSGSTAIAGVGCVSLLDNLGINPPQEWVATLSSTSASVSVVSGASTQVYGPWFSFPELLLKGFGETRLRCSVEGVAPVQSKPFVVAPHFTLTSVADAGSSGSTLISPGDTPPRYVLSAQDAHAQAFALPHTSVEVRLLDEQGVMVQQLDLSTTAGESSLAFQLDPVLIAGAYQVSVNVRIPNSGQSLAITSRLDVHSFGVLQSDLPGAFVALPSTRLHQAYHGSLPAYAGVSASSRVGLLEGALPLGVMLDPDSGDLIGHPRESGTFSFTLYRIDPQHGYVQLLRCSLAVFPQVDPEFSPSMDFAQRGPYAVEQESRSMNFSSGFDHQTYQTTLELTRPPLQQMDQDTPIFIMHRGRGLSGDDYSAFLDHLASHGVLCVSVENTQSFANRYNVPMALPDYDSIPEMGMQSAAFFVDASLRELRRIARDVQDPLFEKFNPNAAIAGGHSRGGGAAHTLHSLAGEMHLRGVVYLMAFDLRFTRRTIQPSAPVRAIPRDLPELPSLIISAERDGDLIYPIADQFIDRASGPTTFATIYGANHNQLADPVVPLDSPASISRDLQQRRSAHLVYAFIRRWCLDDLSTEGLLYGDAYASSETLGIASYRGMASTLMIDDFDDDDPARNSLGGENGYSGGTREEDSFYPDVYGNGFETLNLSHNILDFTQKSAVYQTSFPAQDLAQQTHLTFRIAQDGSQGFDFASIDVRIRDARGQVANIRIRDQSLNSSDFLPEFEPAQHAGTLPFDRFVDVRIPLAAFQAAEAQLDLSRIHRIEIAFLADQAPQVSVALDDLRFE